MILATNGHASGTRPVAVPTHQLTLEAVVEAVLARLAAAGVVTPPPPPATFTVTPWWNTWADSLHPLASRKLLGLRPIHDKIMRAASQEPVSRKALYVRAGGKPQATNYRDATSTLIADGFLLEAGSLGVFLGPRPYPFLGQGEGRSVP